MKLRLPRWRTETPKVVLFNNFILISVCTYLIISAGLNLATTIYPEVHRPAPLDTRSGCNGRKEYCDRRYDNISQIGTHGSAFWGILPTHNQNMGIVAQMDAGIRFLQVQTHKSPVFDQLKACHTSCLVEDAGTLEDYLVKVKRWLLAPGHEREVVSVLVTNGDYVGVGAYEKVFKKVNLTDLMYIPRGNGKRQRRRPDLRQLLDRRNATKPVLLRKAVAGTSAAPPPLSRQDWPTLGDMVKINQRLVVFLDYGAHPGRVLYLLDEFNYFWETPFNTVDLSFDQCKIDRPVLTRDNKAKTEAKMYIVNHYLDTKLFGALVPDRKDAYKTNKMDGRSGVTKHVELCQSLHGGKKPRVLLVDYFDVGELRRAEAWLNGFEK